MIQGGGRDFHVCSMAIFIYGLVSQANPQRGGYLGKIFGNWTISEGELQTDIEGINDRIQIRENQNPLYIIVEKATRFSKGRHIKQDTQEIHDA